MNEDNRLTKKKENPAMNINDVKYQSKIYKGFSEKQLRPSTSSSTQIEDNKNQELLVDVRDTSTFLRSGFGNRKDELRSNAYINELSECCPAGFDVLVDVGLSVNTQEKQESKHQENKYYQDLLQVFGGHASDNEQCSGK